MIMSINLTSKPFLAGVAAGLLYIALTILLGVQWSDRFSDAPWYLNILRQPIPAYVTSFTDAGNLPPLGVALQGIWIAAVIWTFALKQTYVTIAALWAALFVILLAISGEIGTSLFIALQYGLPWLGALAGVVMLTKDFVAR